MSLGSSTSASRYHVSVVEGISGLLAADDSSWLNMVLIIVMILG